jgi:hypothetical protein
VAYEDIYLSIALHQIAGRFYCTDGASTYGSFVLELPVHKKVLTNTSRFIRSSVCL